MNMHVNVAVKKNYSTNILAFYVGSTSNVYLMHFHSFAEHNEKYVDFTANLKSED